MITVQLDWKPNAQFAGLLLADHRGWFAAKDVDVEILPWRPATDPVADLTAAFGNVAVSEDNLAIQAAAAGHDVVVLGSMLRNSPLAWMVRSDAAIESFADFADKTIGVHVDGVTGLDFAMRSADLSAADANVVDVPFDKADQLLAGAIDICQCNGLVEPVEVRADGGDVRVLWAHDAGYQVYSQVLSTSRETVETDNGLIGRFMTTLWEGWRAVYESVDEAAEIIIGNYLDESSEAIQREILVGMRPWVLGKTKTSDTLGSIDSQLLQNSIDILVANKVISTRIQASDLMVELR